MTQKKVEMLRFKVLSNLNFIVKENVKDLDPK